MADPKNSSRPRAHAINGMSAGHPQANAASAIVATRPRADALSAMESTSPRASAHSLEKFFIPGTLHYSELALKRNLLPPEHQADVDKLIVAKREVHSRLMNKFINENGLPLNSSYHAERDQPEHLHPLTGVPVKYIDRGTNKRQEFAVTFNGGRIEQDKVKRMNEESEDLTDRQSLFMFTRRGSNANQLLLTKKETIDPNTNTNTKTQTNHSSFNAGESVANAGFIVLRGRVVSHIIHSSGHYQPDHRSAVKMSEWSERNGMFSPGKARITDHHQKESLDMSQEVRDSEIKKWSREQFEKLSEKSTN